MKRKILLLILGMFLAVSILSLTNSQDASYCCEKTTEGAWCQNSAQENCDSEFRSVPASCEATSYCKLGTCFDSEEGRCLENTPQKLCNEEGGVWEDKDVEEVPQCQLGCCLLGNQASFVTQTRCNRLSSIYGLENNFRNDVENEVSCIALATSDEEGACVYEDSENIGSRTCKRTTRGECNEMSSSGINDSNSEFFPGQLCTKQDLNTNCAKTENTRCVEGKDEVYLVDSCGNIANIYDASKIENQNYWSEIKAKSETCGTGSQDGNADSASCGNCNYFLGSTCKEYERGEDRQKPIYGDNICRDLGCEWKGKAYKHGETWCANTRGVEENLPGSRNFRLVCYNGDVTVEPCADYRQEVCIESKVNGFSNAACRVNRWQDCTLQEGKQNCENEDRRDCQWLEGVKINGSSDENGTCVPENPPGFDFWNANTDASKECSQASVVCNVKCEDPMSGDKTCSSDLGCVDDSGDVSEEWKNSMNELCVSLGDCGASTNYMGIQGYNNESKDAIKKIEPESSEEDGGGFLGIF